MGAARLGSFEAVSSFGLHGKRRRGAASIRGVSSSAGRRPQQSLPLQVAMPQAHLSRHGARQALLDGQ